MAAPHPFERDAPCPLDGVRVLDLSRLVAGNVLSVQLADYGAEVIKIEDPKRGDPLRDWRVKGISVHWKVYGRNKKSLALSLREARGREILLKLVATADILIENFRPGTLEAMELGPDVLHAVNPGLVIVRISGFGQDGPYRDRPGFGTLVEAMSGFAAKNGYPDSPPVLPPMSLADMVAGLYGASAVLVALRHREVGGGKGQVLDLPLLDPLFSILGPDAAMFRLTDTLPPRTGSRSNIAGPRNVFRTNDGHWIAISASMQGMVERLYRAVGHPEMIHDARFATNADRVKNAEASEAPIAAFIAARTLKEGLAAFEAAEITAAPVYDVEQFMADPHVQAREIVVEAPDDEMGTVPMHNVVGRLSDTPGRLRRPAPLIGEHTADLLAEVGCAGAELEALASAGVVKAAARRQGGGA